MKALLGTAAALFAASPSAAQPRTDLGSETSAAAEQGSEIIVEAQRLAEELKDTTLVMVRGNNQATFEFRANGTFKSEMNGLPSDFGEWWVEGERVCFDGRRLDTFCSSMLLDKHPGDTWAGPGYDGKTWQSRLVDHR
jgi:hypothetical protein